MAKQNINVGTAANDKKGDSLRAAFVKVNANFTELYKAVGLADTGQDTALTFVGSTIGTDDSSSIVIDRATTITSNLNVGGDILPQTALGGNLGSSTLPWRSLYVSNNTIYIGGVALGIDANGNLTVNGNRANAPGSTLVNGAYTISIGSDGLLNVAGPVTLPNYGELRPSSTAYDAALAGWESFRSQEAESAAFSGYTEAMRPFIGWRVNGGNVAAYLAELDRVWAIQNTLPTPVWTPPISSALRAQMRAAMLAVQNAYPSVGSDVSIASGQGKYWNFSGDGSLTIPGDIKSNGNINIDINLADSTLRRWQFGEDGALTLPSTGKINNSDYEWTFGSTGILTLPNGAVVKDTAGEAVAFGSQAGLTSQGNGAVAVGNAAGQTTQGIYAVAIGTTAGLTGQGETAVAIGSSAGETSQGPDAVAIGNSAGLIMQATGAVAIGLVAGNNSQGAAAVAIGYNAGYTGQGFDAVAIGDNAGYNIQGKNSVAIGLVAGQYQQGRDAVAIGHAAGVNNQAANTIILNATGSALDQTTANTFTVKPVRQGETADAMYYNSSTGEITYAGAFSFNVAGDDSTQRLVSNNELIKFIGAGTVTTASDTEGNITITGTGGSSIPAVVTTGAVGVGGQAHVKVQFTVASATTVTAVGVTVIGISTPASGRITLSGSPGTGSFDIVAATNVVGQTFILMPFATNASGTGYGAPIAGTGTDPCLVRGTLITMADMSRVAVENITYNDDILVWDFDLGEFASAKPVWIKKTQTAVESCLLTFSDHSELRIVGESPKAHRIFNKEAGKFTYGSMPETPIGTTTFNDQGEEITLISKEWIVGEVEFYNVMTDYHMNLFANSILTSMRYNNVYPITDMKFVKDSRTLRTADDYPNVEERLYKGFRLAEQTQSIEEIETHIQWLLSLEVERETECV